MSPAPVRAALKAFARLIALGFGAALGYYGGFLMIDAWEVPMAGAPIPEGVSYVGLCFGGVLIAIFALERLIAGDYVAAEEG
jgi:TRAP-type C4-dicarboxylate transport system permease small subunit